MKYALLIVFLLIIVFGLWYLSKGKFSANSFTYDNTNDPNAEGAVKNFIGLKPMTFFI